ncbi:MAG: hypothetical protein EOO20_02790 [Chryseobacterium sp.]|nr:MAG: hypothetical protein EOO20_02790 [Chryseobacterium sp.]
MDVNLAILSSNQVSRDGTQFSISALEDAVWLASIHGVPSNLSHDFHRPVGWSYASGLYFEPAHVLMIGRMLIANSNEDLDELRKAKKNWYENLLHDHINPFAAKFRSALGDFFDGNGKFFYNGVVQYYRENILTTIFPDLAEKISADKDELVNLEYLLGTFEYLGYGIFKYKKSELCILAHPYFRRSLSIHNNFHWAFIDELIGQQKVPDVTAKIKIDYNFIGYAPSFLPAQEFEFWWGPKYNDEISSITPGLTQYGSNDFQKNYYQIDRTEFIWKKEKEDKRQLYTLELEEVKNQPTPLSNESYGCRYVHSIWDEDNKAFDHFDGAIRSYDTELMLERIDCKLTEMGRRSNYTKLFRIDGKLPLSNWKSLVTKYLQGNPQIYEYFGLDNPDLQSILTAPKKSSTFEKLVPYSIDKGDGIRLYVSYHEKSSELPQARYFDSYDLLTMVDGKAKSIEYFTVDLVKVFKRLNIEIELPSDRVLVSHEDYYHNIPCIFHSSKNLENNISSTLKGLKVVMEQLIRLGRNEVFSISLSWNLDDRSVNFALLGHSNDLYQWLSQFDSIPITRDKFKTFLEKQGQFTEQNGKHTNLPKLASIICSDGMLYLKRRLVEHDAEITWPDPRDITKTVLKVGKNDTELMEMLSERKISPTPTLMINKIICLSSKQDYIQSPYCVLLDDDVSTQMEDVKILTFHWTDKPRPISFI